ncbi:hypothetical protein CDAR_33221 [Caerostris darwini]|uniref:Uncharacterized protein n=1 Tax=Caerostris darwini TaxID=1538125 RepID=A0AAV4X5T8_9ARAC|nr:hypothetical protein CDAR_33221 [Caerostris darwini]
MKRLTSRDLPLNTCLGVDSPFSFASRSYPGSPLCTQQQLKFVNHPRRLVFVYHVNDLLTAALQSRACKRYLFRALKKTDGPVSPGRWVLLSLVVVTLDA